MFEAYGWPATLTDEEILERLVALNKERAIEEKTGKVRWLRPDYQIPRFGSDAEKAALAEEERRKKAEKDRLAPKQGMLSFEDDLQEMKPKFPTGEELAETAAVMRVLEAAAEPVSIGGIARHFAQGRLSRSASASPSRRWRGLGTFPRRQEGFAERRGVGCPDFARQRCIKEG